MNAIMQRLETGKASVKGMKMLYPATESSLFRVMVKGISFGGSDCRCSDGPQIVIAPIDGVGDLTVPVAKLVDDTKESRDRYFRKHEMDAWKRSNHIRSLGIVGIRHKTNAVLAELKPKQREAIATTGFKLTENNTADAKLNQYELERLLNAALMQKFGVVDADDE